MKYNNPSARAVKYIKTIGYFTVGSNKDEVLAVQGQPNDFDDRVWWYGLSRVFFNQNRVVKWDNSDRNLKAKIK